MMNTRNITGYTVFMIVATIAASFIVYFQEGTSLEDALSFGQLFLELTLLPAAIIVFSVAVRDFKDMQKESQLNLYWDTGKGLVKELDLGLSSQGGKANFLRPVLLNEGSKGTTWYLVDMKIPKGLTTGSPNFKKILGEKENWRDSYDNEGFLWTFMSNGQIAAYPGYGLILGDFSFDTHSQNVYQSRYRIPYTIVSSEGERIDSFLEVVLLPEQETT